MDSPGPQNVRCPEWLLSPWKPPWWGASEAASLSPGCLGDSASLALPGSFLLPMASGKAFPACGPDAGSRPRFLGRKAVPEGKQWRLTAVNWKVKHCRRYWEAIARSSTPAPALPLASLCHSASGWAQCLGGPSQPRSLNTAPPPCLAGVSPLLVEPLELTLLCTMTPLRHPAVSTVEQGGLSIFKVQSSPRITNLASPR